MTHDPPSVLQVSGSCHDSALGTPIYADCTSAGAMPALFSGAGIFQLLPPFFAGGQSYSDVCPASAIVGAGDLRTWAPTLFTASVTAASKSTACDAALNRTGVVVTCSRCFGYAPCCMHV
jgi:hypothetical protein